MVNKQKIKLRPVEPQDLELLYLWENKEENWLVSGTSSPFSKNTLKQYLASIQDIYQDKQLRLIIVDALNEEKGILDFFDYDHKNQRVGMGILIEKSFRNQGIASKAVELGIKYCFETLFLHQIYCNILASNQPSIQLFESHGFIKCGEKKDWIQTKNGWENEYTYQLINSIKK